MSRDGEGDEQKQGERDEKEETGANIRGRRDDRGLARKIQKSRKKIAANGTKYQEDQKEEKRRRGHIFRYICLIDCRVIEPPWFIH